MAVLTKHILGVPSGSVGDAVCFTTWKGKSCIRSLASSYNDANTVRQQGIRNKFALIGECLPPLTEVLNIGWQHYARSGKKARTALNAFVSYELKSVPESQLFIGTFPDFSALDPLMLLVSRGGYPAPSSVSYSGGRVVFPLSDTSVEVGSTCYAVLYDYENQLSTYNSGVYETEGSDVVINVQGGEDWSSSCTLYAFVLSPDGKSCSASLSQSVAL